MAPAVGGKWLLTTLRGALTRFLLQEDHVEDGGDDGGRGLAWGGLYRRRRRRQGRARVSIWAKLEQRKGNGGLQRVL
jgi:hypothetical protein